MQNISKLFCQKIKVMFITMKQLKIPLEGEFQNSPKI